jgi:type I restriction enzyme M protein
MRHFATESGKSKGQFYTPAEVSRIIAQILGIRDAKTSSNTTVYDPTCGSGSLLLRVDDEATTDVTLYGQEKDAATSGLARMNMILHNNPTALIVQGNTLTDPKFKDGGTLKIFDYVVANPPFSVKRWSTGLNPSEDTYERFKSFGTPPAKQGDYAYLLHIVRSLKSTGKGACILPHGVLFRGHAEADIRRALVRKGYIKGIIGLPANLFYGTGIPACIVVDDKQDAHARKGIFMIDASGGFMKDGPKNRLRSQDIHKIVDVFTRQLDIPRFARMVSAEEIEKNEFNLNLPRYIDSQTPEDIQDIEGHLRGGIPKADVDGLDRYWAVCPQLRQTLFKNNRHGYLDLAVEKPAIKSSIYEHPEFAAFIDGMNAHFATWRDKNATTLKALKPGCHPKEIVAGLSEDLLAHYVGKPLIDSYDVYQHLMEYWAETMQDDCYLIATDGWVAPTHRVLEQVKSGKKKGQEKDVGWTCDLIPKPLIVARYYMKERAAIDQLSTELESVTSKLTELEEEHGGEEGTLKSVGNKTDALVAWLDALIDAWQSMDATAYGLYARALSEQQAGVERLVELESDPRVWSLANAKEKITQTKLKARLKEPIVADERALLETYKSTSNAIKDAKKSAKDLMETAGEMTTKQLESEPDNEMFADLRVINAYLDHSNQISEFKAKIKYAEADLDAKAYAHYPTLTEAEIKTLAVDDKWLAALDAAIHGEMDRVSQALAQRVKELADRYETPVPEMIGLVADMEAKVNRHLEKMGFSWT